MQIGKAAPSNPYLQNAPEAKDPKEFKEKIKSGEISAKALSQAYLVEYSLTIESYSSDTIQTQGAVFDLKKVADILDTVDFEAIGYSGKEIAKMTPEEAKDLVSEDGYFGISQTSQRLADFVIKGGGDDIERLKAGREGIIRGFNDAEQIWGEKLPDISYSTLEKALAMIDEKIGSLGGSVLDTTA